jgi:crossover junction endodeoxyribonuclease RusA
VLLSEQGRRYRRVVKSYLRAATDLPQVTDLDRLALTIAAYPPDRRKRDLDNLLKPLIDALMHAGAFPDDSQLDLVAIGRGERRKGAGCVIVRFGVAKQSGDCYLPVGSVG